MSEQSERQERPTQYPGIRRAALAIAYDNGGINRYRSERQMFDEFERWITHQPADILPAIDAWLLDLSDEHLNLICAGDEVEQAEILQSAPPFTDKLLTDYFDEVC